MSKITKPMTADKVQIDKVIYPVIATPKLDGIRCLKIDGKVLSRSFKPIANVFIRETLTELLHEGMDGEIMSGETFGECSSNVMGRKGEPDFVYNAFDMVSSELDEPYLDRLVKLRRTVDAINDPRVRYVQEVVIGTEAELLSYEGQCLDAGYEGIMLRHPDGPYKCGCSTVRQGWLMKFKRFVDSEAVIIGFEEQMHNENELTKDELGHAKRSSAKAGKVPAGTLGKFLVRDLTTGVELAIGTGLGLTFEIRQEVWDNRDKYMGKLVKYKSQPTGVKDKPRFPIWLGFRSPDDMDADAKVTD